LNFSISIDDVSSNGEFIGRVVACDSSRNITREITLADPAKVDGLLSDIEVCFGAEAAGQAEALLKRAAEDHAKSEHHRPEFAQPITAATLVEHGPAMAEPIVEGVCRVGEIVNIISGSKSYKTYLLIALLLCITAGKTWLGFTTHRVRVLLIDNELHPGTLKHRIRTIASALAIDLNELGDFFQVVSLRGRLRDIRQMRGFFAGIKPGHYGVVALDSWYRLIPPDVDEISNSQMTGLYNLLDEYAAMLLAAIVLIHHSTKGRQGDKQITDVGAGAGAMSRAADCHLILRAHRNDDCAVLQSALRSFAPMPPIGLRWTYPTWGPAQDIDVTDLQRDKAKRIADKPEEPAEEPWTPQRFTATFLAADPRTEATILSAADAADLSERKAKRLLNAAMDGGLAYRWTYANRKTPHRFAIIEQPVTATDGGIL
jgi:hypothetical protein